MLLRHTMNENERIILNMIVENPFLSQEDLAERCGLSRPMLATYIGQLTRKGFRIGRANIVAKQGRSICIGGAAIDRKYRLAGPIVPGTSNPAAGHTTFGGVARNVCENLVRLGGHTTLLAVVGDDASGHALVEYMKNCGTDTSRIKFATGAPTAEYVAILDGESNLGVGIFDASVADFLDVAYLQCNTSLIASTDWVFVDCNISADVLAWLVREARQYSCRLVFDTVSISKAQRLRGHLHDVEVLFTNQDEAVVLLPDGTQDLTIPDLAAALVRNGVRVAVITEGARGLTVADAEGVRRIEAVSTDVVDVTGAGDALVAATLTALMEGADVNAACRHGVAAAAMTIGCRESVYPDLNRESLDLFMKKNLLSEQVR
ncbi:ribokinase-like domain-containing protein [Acetobacter senegalensis]|uniref:Ribokinase-like domain-containing protein n=1 Tax=Acetobacter senegalensis TaxID=446692 RepID=A0A0U5ET84_9PROT|nr:carbohydrate kinase [Acetobacter senegalensis]CEF40687.1 ribokinase-like domain-containing protein [Acetobacter senegalensis]